MARGSTAGTRSAWRTCTASRTCPTRSPRDARTQPANVVVPAYFADYERRFDLPVVRPVRVDSVSGEGGLLVVRRRRPDLAHPHPGQRHRHLDPAVRPALPGHRDLRRASSCTRSTTRARSTSPGAASSWSAAVPPRCSSSASWPRSPTRLGDPPPAGVAHRRLRPGGRPRRRHAGRRPRTPRAAADERRGRHRARPAPAGARGGAARRLPAAADVRPDRADRGALATRRRVRGVRAGRRRSSGPPASVRRSATSPRCGCARRWAASSSTWAAPCRAR